MAKAFVKHDYAVTGRDYVETEGGGDTPAGGISYSTEEQDTGIKWLDGRTVYQKTFTYETFIEVSPTAWTATGSTVTGGDTVLTAWGISASGVCAPLMGYFDSGALKIQTPRNSNNSEVSTLTITYIKTE